MATTGISDLEINNHIRRLLTKRRIDATKTTYRTATGVVNIGGSLVFIGPQKDVDELPKQLQLLEEMIRSIRGVKNVKIDFDDFEKDDVTGEWLYKGKLLSREEQVREKIKERTTDNKQVDVKKMIMQDDESFADDAGVLRSEALSKIMSLIEKITIRCPDCGIEYKYCLTCGTTLKVEILPKIDANLLPDEPSKSATAAPAGPSMPLTAAALEEMEDEDGMTSKKREKTPEELEAEQYPDETPEERKRRKLREKALDLLRSSRENKIKKASWSKRVTPGSNIDFDDL